MSGPTSPSVSPLASLPSLTSHQQRLLLAALQSRDQRRINMQEFLEQSPSNQIFKNTLTRNPSTSQGVDPHIFDTNFPHKSPSTSSSRASWEEFPVPSFGKALLSGYSNGQETDYDIDLPQDVVDSLSAVGNGEKRKSPEDEDDDGEDDNPKRRGSDDKAPKKPGRKPLTVEPTTKRKAQNRAAQRAFRERKEQHLKDLEQKISDLQRISHNANHENSLLRAQVMTLQSEVQAYRKRMSFNGGIAAPSQSPKNAPFASFHNGIGTSSNPFDFNFDAPTNQQLISFNPSGSSSTYFKPEPTSHDNSNRGSPTEPHFVRGNSVGSTHGNNSLDTGSSNLSSGQFFDTGFFDAGGASDFGFPQFGSPDNFVAPNSPHQSRGNRSSASQPRSLSGSTGSPSSSVSRNGPSSSCGTSPEPSNDSSIQLKPTYHTDNAKSPFGDLADFQFDPTLFGGYRETQDAIYGDGDFTGGLYDDFLNMPDTTFDYSNANIDSQAEVQANGNGQKNRYDTPMAKSKLMDQVARNRDTGPEDNLHPPPPGTDGRQMMTCHKIWNQLKECPKFQQGDLDIDALCSELSKKATCSESGAQIPKDEWESALWKMVGQPDGMQKDAAGGKSSTTST